MILNLKQFVATSQRLGALGLWAPGPEGSLTNQGSAEIPIATLVNGCTLIEPGMLPGSATGLFDGTNDYINTNWLTRTNLVVNPLKKWSNFFTEKFGSTVTEEKEGYPTFVTAVSKVSEAGNTQFIPVSVGEKCRFPVVAGEKITVKVTFNVVKNVGMTINYGLRFVKAAGTFISNSVIGVVGTGIQTVTHTFEVPATAELEFAQPIIFITSPNSVEVKEAVVAWKEPVMERGTTVGTYFPTAPQLVNGEAGWSGIANESFPDLGPFARGVGRTFAMAFKQQELVGTRGLFGPIAGGNHSGAFVTAAGTPTFRLADGTTVSDKAASEAAKPAGVIYMVAFAWDGVGNTLSTYVNGVKKLSAVATTTTHVDTNNPFVVGTFPGTFFQGEILPFAVFPSVLTEAQVQELYEPKATVAVRTVFPPDKIAINGKAPSGQPFRWAEDEKDTDNTAGNITISDEMPGGWKQIAGVLARDPRKGYGDLIPYSDMFAYIPGGRHIWEGSLDLIPDVSGNQQSINPGGVGYQSMLEDNKAITVGFLNRDLTRWIPAGAVRKKALIGINQAILNDASVVMENTGASLHLQVEGAWTSPMIPRCEGWFAAGPGIGVRAVYADILHGPSDFLFELFVKFGEDQIPSAETGSGDLYTETEGSHISQSPEPTLPPTPYAFFIWKYLNTNSGVAGAVWSIDIANLVVQGDPPLKLKGTWPAVGYYSKQMLTYLINTFTDLEAVEAEMDCENYLIEDAWYDTPAPASSIVKDIAKYEWMDWFVYRGKKFDYKRPGSYGKRWRSTLKESELNETGIDGQRLWKSIVVQWTDPGSGAIYTAGPLGSKSFIESSLLEITDPQHPAVLAKRTRKDILVISVPITSTTAVELGGRFLEEAQLIDHSGSATLTGYVMDDKGVFYPVSVVKSGDYISVTDSKSSAYRKIVNKTYTHSSRQSQIDLDAPATGLEELLERLNASLIPAGVST